MHFLDAFGELFCCKQPQFINCREVASKKAHAARNRNFISVFRDRHCHFGQSYHISLTRKHTTKGNGSSHNKSKIICTDSQGISPSNALYRRRNAAEEKGKLCFIKRKDKSFISKNRGFRKEKVAFFHHLEIFSKNKWTFSRYSPYLLRFLSPFEEKAP